MDNKAILELAEHHNLKLKEGLTFNDMGIDFRIVFARDQDGLRWVLRIPRRTGMGDRIEQEKNILGLAKKYLSTGVPDWRIVSDTLIAYPMMEDEPALTFDARTFEVSWNIDKDNPAFVQSLAKVMTELHQVPVTSARAAGLKVLSPEMARQEIKDRIETVKRELGMKAALEARWNNWVDEDRLWPDFSGFIHGDLYAGHTLTTKDDQVSGIIDWSEGQVSDISIDFAGHVSAFGAEHLKKLIEVYIQAGGKVWDTLYEQTIERHAASALNYGIFAIQTGSDPHIEAAKAQLGVS